MFEAPKQGCDSQDCWKFSLEGQLQVCLMDSWNFTWNNATVQHTVMQSRVAIIYLYLFLCVTYIVYGCSHRTQKHHPFGFARRPQTAERQPRPWDLVHHSEIEGFNRFLFARIAKYIQISFSILFSFVNSWHLSSTLMPCTPNDEA